MQTPTRVELPASFGQLDWGAFRRCGGTWLSVCRVWTVPARRPLGAFP
jgi:hypothetical protein